MTYKEYKEESNKLSQKKEELTKRLNELEISDSELKYQLAKYALEKDNIHVGDIIKFWGGCYCKVDSFQFRSIDEFANGSANICVALYGHTCHVDGREYKKPSTNITHRDIIV